MSLKQTEIKFMPKVKLNHAFLLELLSPMSGILDSFIHAWKPKIFSKHWILGLSKNRLAAWFCLLIFPSTVISIPRRYLVRVTHQTMSGTFVRRPSCNRQRIVWYGSVYAKKTYKSACLVALGEGSWVSLQETIRVLTTVSLVLPRQIAEMTEADTRLFKKRGL